MSSKISIVAIAGAPNAGKSTLVNQLVGQKIAIVTSKCQTTRFNTKGVINTGETQIVFIDTPGLFHPTRTLEQDIVQRARIALEEADRVCLTVDAAYAHQDLSNVIKALERIQKPVVLLLNKVDLIKNKENLLPMVAKMSELYAFEAVFMLSAKKNRGLNEMKAHLVKHALPGQWIFDAEVASDVTDRKFAEEVTRESLFYALGAELPYSLEVQTELFEERDDGSVKIHQIIHVLKASQKKIVLGKRGEKLRDVGQRARLQIAEVLSKRVHLFLYVKVKPDWIERSARVQHCY